jgi:hypothetical protein
MAFVAYYTLKLDVMVVVTCYALKAWHNDSRHLLHTQDRDTKLDTMILITWYTLKIETQERRMKNIEKKSWVDLKRITMAIVATFFSQI